MLKKLEEYLKGPVDVSENESFFLRYRAVTWTMCIGTLASILIFVGFLQHGLSTQQREFRTIARSELSIVQKELEDLELSLTDAYSRLKEVNSLNMDDIELVFRGELRSRTIGLIFFLNLQGPSEKLRSAYHVLGGDQNLISVDGLPNVLDFKNLSPQVVRLAETHPLYRPSTLLVGLPFPERGTLYLTINISRLIQDVADRKVFESATEIYLFSGEGLFFSAEPIPGEQMKVITGSPKEKVKEYSAFHIERAVLFLNESWAAFLTPAQSYLSSGMGYYPWLFFIACMLITALISFAFYQMISSRIETERTVRIRTHELQKKTDELAKLNKDLNDFAYIVSHDLQEPIRTISSFMDVFLAEYGQSVSAE